MTSLKTEIGQDLGRCYATLCIENSEPSELESASTAFYSYLKELSTLLNDQTYLEDARVFLGIAESFDVS